MNIKSLQMKRMVLPILVTLLLSMAGLTKVYASYDFTDVTSTGQTLYFKITNNSEHLCKMVYPGSSNSNPWGMTVQPSGMVFLPAMVYYNGATWYVKSIDNYTFYGCTGITEAIIADGINTVGDYSFYGCTGLETLTIGPAVTSIGDYSFWNCPSLTTVHYNAINCGDMFTYSSGTNYTYYSVFNSGTLNSGIPAIDSLTIGNGVNRIPNFAFSNCQNLSGNLELPSSLISIGQQAFYHCNSLTGALTIPNSVTSIGSDAFNGCGGFMGALTLSEVLGSIGSGAFYGCGGLTGHVVIPSSVTSLGDYSFYDCVNITELTIGSSVGSIGDYSFWSCPSLTTVHFNAVNCGDMYTYGSGTNYNYYSVFNTGTQNTGSSAIETLTIGSGVNRIPNYAFRNSQNLLGELTLPDGLIYIGQQSFYNCHSLTGSLSIPNSVTSIGSDAFNSCSGFYGELTLSNQLTTIGSGAFCDCGGLWGDLVIPNSVTSLGDYSFYGCDGITSLTIGEGVTSIGDYSFWNCPLLTTVHFNAVNCSEMYTYGSNTNYNYYSVFNSGTLNSGTPAITVLSVGLGVNQIPNYAFRNCQSMQSFNLPPGLVYIGQQAFYNCHNLTGNLSIPNSVTSIGDNAFNGCYGFNGTLTLSNQLGSIGAGAFSGCSGIVGHVVIPNSVTSLSDNSFYGCTGIEELTIGTGVTSIGDYSFWNCPSLETVHFNAVNCGDMYTYGSSTNYNYYSVFNNGTLNSGVPAIKTLSIGNTVNRIPNYAFRNSQNLEGTLSLPNSLIYIGEQSFLNCNGLTGVLLIPNSVTNIGADAFNGCWGFSGTLLLRNQVTSVGSGAFSGCSGLSQLVLSNGLQTIGNSAFNGCMGLSGQIIIPNSVTSIGDNAFYGCTNITDLTIGTGVTSIGDYAFWNCPSLTTVHFNAVNCGDMYTYGSGTNYNYYSVFNAGMLNSGSSAIETLTIGNGVNRIPNYAFRNSQNLSGELVLPNGLIYIGQQSFYNCNSLTGQLTIHNSVTSIGADAFNGCSGFSGTLTLSNQLETIGNAAFCGCSGLTGHVVIPNPVTSLGDYSFYGCTEISELTIGTGVTSIGDYSFWNCPSLTTVHFNAVSCGDMFTYGSGTNYNYYSVFNSGTLNTGSSAITNLSIGNNVNRIPNYAFRNSPDLTGTLTLPTNVMYIGKSAFYNCSSLTGPLTIPNSVTSIGDNAFDGCIGFTETLTLSNQLTTIGQAAFYGCSGLTGHVVIPNSVTSLGDYSFYGCTNITEITIGESVGSIGDYSFWNCPSLATVHFNAVNCGDMHTYGSSTNYNYYSVFNTGTLNNAPTAIMTLTIGSGVNRIPNYAFRNSPSLLGVSFPQVLTTIGTGAFYDCVNLVSVTLLPTTPPSVGNDAFHNVSLTIPVFVPCNLSGTYATSNGWSQFANIIELCSNNIVAIAYPSFAGTVTGSGTYAPGQICFLTAIPNEGYYFYQWRKNNGEIVSTNSTYNFTVLESGSYVAIFRELTTYTVQASINPSEGGNVTGAGFYNQGQTCTLTAIPNEGYSFVNWTENGVPVSTSSNYSFTVTGNRNLVANFMAIPVNYIINVSTNPSNGGTVTGGGSYQQGTTCTVTATANEGYSFFSWMENGEEVSASASYSFTVTSGRNLVAFFIATPVDCIINASASPSNGGSVIGAGTYALGETCTLSASANPGYTFIGWTEGMSLEAGGVIISSEPNYSFTVTGNWNVVANFNSNPFHWNVDIYEYPFNMSVTGIIQIFGEEQNTPALEIGAFCGDVCRGTQRLTYFSQVNRYLVFFSLYGDAGDVMSFRLYDHTLGEELDLSCSATISFVPDGSIGNAFNPYIFDFGDMIVEQTSSFSHGYNWWSTYIEQNGIDGLSLLENSLGANGLVIKSQSDGYTEYYEDYNLWYGSLESINNESSYMVMTSVPCTVTLSGTTALSSQHPITVDADGWTWIGYPVTYDMDINTALEGLASLEGDVLKSQEGYAEFYEGYGWFGSLTTFLSSKGYMYKSTNTSPTTFTYPDNGRAATHGNITSKDNHWVPAVSAYPFNMTVTAVIELDGEELRSDRYELAAFANGESRGSVRLMYVEPIDRYVAFLTIAGEESADLSFALYDTETGMEFLSANEVLTFEANATVGRLAEPFVVSFRGTTGMDELANSLRVYPNPVNTGERFSIGLNAESKAPVRVEIVNALGVVVSVETSIQAPASIVAPVTAGVYTLRVTVEGKGTAVRKLVVK